MHHGCSLTTASACPTLSPSRGIAGQGQQRCRHLIQRTCLCGDQMSQSAGDREKRAHTCHPLWRSLHLACGAGTLCLAVGTSHAFGVTGSDSDTLDNIPSELTSPSRGPPANLGKLLKEKGVQDCARKCVATCVRGGEGAPGLGPLSVRKEIIVFNEGFRSRQYCLSECTQVCAAALARK